MMFFEMLFQVAFKLIVYTFLYFLSILTLLFNYCFFNKTTNHVHI